MREKEVVKYIAEKYSAPEYAFLSHVRNQTGYAVSDGIRTADGLALGLYPSRGMYLNGFEIKTSRNDWINEKMRPEKADAIGKYCHYWWLVTSDEKIVQADELPDTWGLQVVINEKLIVKKQAKFMNPEQPTFNFLAGIFRKMAECNVPSELVNQRIDERVKQIIKSEEWEAEHRVERCDKLERKVEEFEQISGIRIDDWNLGDVASAVRVIRESKSSSMYEKLLNIQKTAEGIVEDIKDVFKNKQS